MSIAVSPFSSARDRSQEPVRVQFNDALRLTTAEAQPAQVPELAPGVELAVRLLEMFRAEPAFPLRFCSKIASALAAAKSSYLTEIILCFLSDQTPPGPLELALRHGVTKQAVSAEILESLERVRAEDPTLAASLESYREECASLSPEPLAARYREQEFPVAKSFVTKVINVEFEEGAPPVRASVLASADVIHATSVDGQFELTLPRDQWRSVVMMTSAGLQAPGTIEFLRPCTRESLIRQPLPPSKSARKSAKNMC